MRIGLIVSGLLLSMGAAHADKVVASGRPLLLYQAYSTNPDCSSTGTVALRIAQAPEHGRVSIRQAGVLPRFPESDPRSACNRRRVSGVEAPPTSRSADISDRTLWFWRLCSRPDAASASGCRSG